MHNRGEWIDTEYGPVYVTLSARGLRWRVGVFTPNKTGIRIETRPTRDRALALYYRVIESLVKGETVDRAIGGTAI